MLAEVFRLLAEIFSLLAIIMISWLIGLLLAAYLERRQHFGKSSLWLLGSSTRYTHLGIGMFKWLVTKTAYRHLNRATTLSPKPTLEELVKVRNAMTRSEFLHAIAFVLVLTVGLPTTLVQQQDRQVVPLLLLNVIFNLYPVLLQQYNKERLDRVIRSIRNVS